LTRAQIDIVLVLLTSISKDDEDFKDYEFTLRDLELKTGRQWNSKQLKEALTSIKKEVFELPTINGIGGIVSWISYGGWNNNNGTYCLRFDKALKPFLLDLKGRYIISDIRHLLPMKSSYSKRIYLLLKERFKFGFRKFLVSDLMETLQVPKSFLAYGEFKKKVLLRAEKDINMHTDILVSFEERKIGRKVNEVVFTIRQNKNAFQEFVKMIRELYINESLLVDDVGTLACSGKGYLYYREDPDLHFNKDESLKKWILLFMNREKLLIFKPDLFSLNEVVK
jgi:plasmid replication initiation protein